MKTDDQLQKDVLDELKWEPRLHSSTEVGVTVKSGIVTLTGTVDSYTKRWAAEQATHRVKGVRAVANDIEVKLPFSSERTDGEIAAAVVHALEANTWLKADVFDITVSSGWITLKGQIDWNFEREEAERSVRDLWGVRGVTNLVGVRSRPTSTQLKQEIEKALIRTAEADVRNIQVDVQGSKVILKGKVRAWAEREEAERVAWMAPGVTQIEDHIVVTP